MVIIYRQSAGILRPLDIKSAYVCGFCAGGFILAKHKTTSLGFTQLQVQLVSL